MKVLIIGSGAIGTFIGGVLAKSGQDVTFLDLPEVVQRIKSQGITVEGIGEKIHIDNPSAIGNINDNLRFDLAVLSVKSYTTVPAIKNLPAKIADFIITFQNGIGNEDILAEKFGKQKVIAGSITYPVAVMGPGHIKIENQKGGLGIAPMDPTIDIGEIPSLFQKAGLNVENYDNYRSMKWSKLMLNIVCNATCAILGMTPGQIFSDRRLVGIERESIRELLKVMKKKKIPVVDLPGYSVKLMKNVYSLLPPSLLKLVLKNRIKKSRGDKKPSLLIEVEKGSKITEVDVYNGAIYESARKIGIPAPINSALTEILDKITSGEVDWNEFKENPDRLIEACR